MITIEDDVGDVIILLHDTPPKLPTLTFPCPKYEK